MLLSIVTPAYNEAEGIIQTVESLLHLEYSEYEIIVDYKGSRRPPIDNNPRGDWELGEWQVQTCAWLRSQQIDARPVAAGVLVYVNELAPGGKEMSSLRTEMARGLADVVPEVGSANYYQVNTWTSDSAPNLSREFRLRRAIRVVRVDQEAVSGATTMIDQVVRDRGPGRGGARMYAYQTGLAG